MKINSKVLIKIISNIEWLRSQKTLLEVYDSLSPSQRSELKELLIKNKNNG